MAWDKSEETAQYLSTMMVEIECGMYAPRFYLKHAIGGYTCKCGCKMNIWSDGLPGTCPECNGRITTNFRYHPELHNDPDYGPDIKTIERAAQIAESRKGF